jgi:hypothetical protein
MRGSETTSEQAPEQPERGRRGEMPASPLASVSRLLRSYWDMTPLGYLTKAYWRWANGGSPVRLIAAIAGPVVLLLLVVFVV